MLIERHPGTVIWARTVTAVLALGTLGGLIVILKGAPYGVDPRFVTLARVLLVPLGLTTLGLVAGLWSRWLALAGAVAVLPWAAVLTFGLHSEAPVVRPAIALVASLVLLRSLSGREIAARYERRTAMEWEGWRMRLVQWTIILNLSSLLSGMLQRGSFLARPHLAT